MVRLRRVRNGDPGWSRRRHGRGVVFLDEHGERITDPVLVARCHDLVIPPAWADVWICPLENGHIQAMGTDDAGRRQYLYHPQWRLRRDRAKHQHVLQVGRRLPRARKVVAEHLQLPGLPREKVLALAFRLLDEAYFRAGGEAYAKENGSYGLATVLREHVQVDREGVRFCYPAKSGQVRESRVDDPVVRDVVRRLRDRDGGGPELLAWQEEDGSWHDVVTRDIVDYVKARLGPEARLKDFRTWHGTVLAAAALADHEPARCERARRRVVAQVMREVSEELGNTPAVCRASYVDPRLVDLWERGRTIGRRRTRGGAEKATLELLA